MLASGGPLMRWAEFCLLVQTGRRGIPAVFSPSACVKKNRRWTFLRVSGRRSGRCLRDPLGTVGELGRPLAGQKLGAAHELTVCDRSVRPDGLNRTLRK